MSIWWFIIGIVVILTLYYNSIRNKIKGTFKYEKDKGAKYILITPSEKKIRFLGELPLEFGHIDFIRDIPMGKFKEGNTEYSFNIFNPDKLLVMTDGETFEYVREKE